MTPIGTIAAQILSRLGEGRPTPSPSPAPETADTLQELPMRFHKFETARGKD